MILVVHGNFSHIFYGMGNGINSTNIIFGEPLYFVVGAGLLQKLVAMTAVDQEQWASWLIHTSNWLVGKPKEEEKKSIF